MKSFRFLIGLVIVIGTSVAAEIFGEISAQLLDGSGVRFSNLRLALCRSRERQRYKD